MAEAASRPAAWQVNFAQRAAAVDGQIRAEAARIVASLPGQVAAQDAAVKSQLAEYQAIQREVSRMDQLQSELDPLENDARIAIKQYNDFKSSDSATKPDVAFIGVNVRVMSQAAVPYHAYFPNNMLMISRRGSNGVRLRHRYQLISWPPNGVPQYAPAAGSATN